ncbi:ovostatin-like [Carettochelys insculpta]|uniref:ovostatin-like n=1 Tax=Carettochelys insculpta TaxID=44489 RepID=UPI003EB9AE9B
MWLRFLLSTTLLHLTAAYPFELQYILMVPSVLQSGSPDQACLQIQHLNESVSVEVTLQHSSTNITILKQGVRRDYFFKCIRFMTPPATSSPLAFITFSAKGNTTMVTERRSVAILNVESIVFVQTDKPIYKPGQTVLCRIVALDLAFRPVQETYPLITIQDPQGNQIFQWLNVSSQTAIVHLTAQIIPEPILGIYKISVSKKSGSSTHHLFAVEEYVLPKFEVTVKAPKSISILTAEFKVKVCGVYTYGQPVEGTVQLSMCRDFTLYGNCKRDPLCQSVTKTLGKDGCISQVFSSRVFELNRSGYQMNLAVKALMTEKGTGVQLPGSAYISITQVLGSVRFENMDQSYKRGIPYSGQMKLTNEDDSPIANEVVQLLLNDKNVDNYTTDGNGTIQFSINTSNMFNPQFSLRAIYKTNDDCKAVGWLVPYYPEAYYSVQRFYSKTNSFVKIGLVPEELRCGQKRLITVYYVLNKKGYGRVHSVTFYYVIMVKGKIVHSGKLYVRTGPALKGTFSISLAVSEKLAPVARMLVYTVHPSKELVADVARFQIEKCFKNKVQLNFSETQGLPGSNVSLHLLAAANSLCALRAVDESVLLLRPEQELSAETVYNLLPIQELYGYIFNGLNLEDDTKDPCVPANNIFYKGLYYTPASTDFSPDVYQYFKEIGMKAFTNSQLRQPVVCGSVRPTPDILGRPILGGSSAIAKLSETVSPEDSQDRSVIHSVRTFFPTTWIWTDVLVNATGQANTVFTIPDSITKWKASAFCLEKQAGFGISETISLTAFQSFFVDLAMPYSIIHREVVLLRANIFSYRNECIRVGILLATSQDYEAQLLSPQTDDECVCASERKTYVWNIIPKKLGDVTFNVTAETKQSAGRCGNTTSGSLEIGWKDTLIRTLLVEPEGIKRSVTQSNLICTQNAVVVEPVSLKLPANLVEGSARAFCTVIGDIMGIAMHNLQQLLQMPFGCGEQNMALLAPNLYVLDYLNNTGQLTKEMESKGIGHLVSGYQKQLSYKHPDGSYSIFGTRDKEGNTWLTAFVYLVFAGLRRYIYIDEKVQSQTFIWLSSKQKSNGCFQSVGKLFNNALKGGVDDELSLTAYVTTALLEAGHPSSHPVVRNGLFCLEAAPEEETRRVYTQALLAYIFCFIGNEGKCDFFLTELEKSAKKVDGSVHWEREVKPPAENVPSFYTPAPSAEIEMTCYVLLAVLRKPNLSSKDLTFASESVQWVIKQQNSFGGFTSTQDTVLALRALADYGAKTYSENIQNTVKISSSKPFEKIFEVNNQNRLLLQQSPLPDVPGNYTLEVDGKGCVFVQITLRYNILLPRKASGFSLSVQTANVSCTDNFRANFAIILSTSYTGQRNISNMAIIDVKMLSGFVPVRSSLQKLREDRKVMQVETKQNHVLFYLESVSQNITSFSFSVEQDLAVSDIKPAPVLIYDYYETDENAVAEYNLHCNDPGPRIM